MVNYISPTQLDMYHGSMDKYYLRYFTEWGRAYAKQGTTPAMCVGSAFDGMIKKELVSLMGGAAQLKGGVGGVPAFLESVVMPVANACFQFYLSSGAFMELVTDIRGCRIVMEDTLQANVSWAEAGGDAGRRSVVPFYGKPDLWGRLPDSGGKPLILDWKVSGFFDSVGRLKAEAAAWLAGQTVGSGVKKTPVAGGYLREFGPHGTGRGLLDRSETGIVHGVRVGLSARGLKKWLHQLCLYGWMLGEEVGAEDWVVCLDLICPGRIVQYRGIVPASYQRALIRFAVEMWETVSRDGWRIERLERLIELGVGGGQGPAIEALEAIMDSFGGSGVLPSLIH